MDFNLQTKKIVFCWKIFSGIWIDGDTIAALAQPLYGIKSFYSTMVRAVEVSHKELAEDFHMLSQEESQRSCLPRMDQSEVCTSRLKILLW